MRPEIYDFLYSVPSKEPHLCLIRPLLSMSSNLLLWPGPCFVSYAANIFNGCPSYILQLYNTLTSFNTVHGLKDTKGKRNICELANILSLSHSFGMDGNGGSVDRLCYFFDDCNQEIKYKRNNNSNHKNESKLLHSHCNFKVNLMIVLSRQKVTTAVCPGNQE